VLNQSRNLPLLPTLRLTCEGLGLAKAQVEDIERGCNRQPLLTRSAKIVPLKKMQIRAEVYALLVVSFVFISCGAKSDSSGPCGAQGQACCGSSQCEADAGLACDKGHVCAFASPEAQGHACVTNGDCQSNVCVAIGDNPACVNACVSTTDCIVKGWACDMGKGHCTCSASQEICNGIDDDCNGIVDDNAASSDCNSQMVGSSCSDGSCRCPGYQNTCGNVCTDQASDPANCGSSNGGTACNDCAYFNDPTLRVIRGRGGPTDTADLLRAAARFGSHTTTPQSVHGIGFRCARD
jgi:hypothetical protein